MSIEALRWALEEGQARELEPPKRHILLMLGNRADERGYCFPSIAWVCKRTGYTRRTVQMHMKDLEAAGLLRRDMRPDGKGGRTSDAIWLGLRQPGLPLPDPSADFALGGGQDAARGAVDVRPPRAPRAPKKKEDTQEIQKPSGPSPAAQCAAAYQHGIKARYQADYPGSAKLNGIMAQLVKELGAEPALAVVQGYLASGDKWYVLKRHALEYLKRDAAQIWIQLQERSGQAARGPAIATAYIEKLGGDETKLRDYAVDEPERLARAVLKDYGMRLDGWQAKNIIVQIGARRHPFSIAELRA